MKANLKIQKSIEKLLKSGQSLNEINNNLNTIIVDWYHPIEDKHRNTVWVYRLLNDLLVHLNNVNLCNADVSKMINSWFSIHPEDGIDDLIDNLHDLMLCWLDNTEAFQSEEVHVSVFKTYRTLRNFLTELKIIEREINIKKGVIIIG